MTKLTLAMLVIAVGCRQGATSVDLPKLTDAELAARAREDFQRSCAPCHGADGRGTGATRATSGAAPPDLTRLAERLGPRFSEHWVADVISGEREVPAHGTREMPVWSIRFGRADSGPEVAAALWAQRRLNALASYVVSLQAPAGAGGGPAAAR